MLSLVLRRVRLLIMAIALTAITWTTCQAIGSFQTKPAFPNVETANDRLPPSTIARLNIFARALAGSCGKGRISDPRTHDCHGPADIRSIEP